MNENNFNNMNNNMSNNTNNNMNNINYNNQPNPQINNMNYNNQQPQSMNNNYNPYQTNTIVQPSMNPGYQVNNGMNNNQNIQSNISNQQTKNKTGFPIIIIVVILGFFGVVIGGSFILNLITAPVSTAIINDNISEANLSAAKSTAYGYIDALEKYVILSELETGVNEQYYSVKVPKSNDKTVTCSKIDNEIWSGEVLTTSSSCDDFMNAVEKNSRGLRLDGGKIIFDQEGKVYDGSWLIKNSGNKKIYCIYNNAQFDCSTKKPE